MTEFWSLVRESIIIQSLITLGLVGVLIYMTVAGLEIPEVLETLTFLVVGFWFGSKVENATTKEVVKKFTEGS